MKLALRLGLAASLRPSLAGAASSAAAPPAIVEAGGVTLPGPRLHPHAAVREVDLADRRQRHRERRARQQPDGSAPGQRRAHDRRRARDRRVAHDEGQADRRRARGRQGVRQGREPDDQQIAIVTFNANVNVLSSRSRRAPRRSSARSTTSPSSPTGRRTTTRSTQSLKMIQDSGAQSGSVIILTDGQNVGSVAKPADVLAALKARARPRVLGRARVARVQAGPLEQMASGDRGRLRRGEHARGASADRRLDRAAARERVPAQYQTRQNPNTKVDVAGQGRRDPRRCDEPVQDAEARDQAGTALQAVDVRPRCPVAVDDARRCADHRGARRLGCAQLHVPAPRRARRSRRRVRRGAAPPALRAAPIRSAEQPGSRSSFLTRISASTSESSWSARLAETLELADIKAEPSRS